jgi:Antidote-toxin recognition MazE, bacterial antitoxin
MKDPNNLIDLETIKESQNLYRRIQGLVGEQSFSMVLPKQYAINLGIRKGDFVKVRQEENKIIIEKA